MEIQVKEALYKLNKKGVPYSFDLNIYRGCQHGCKYCYAFKSHEYLGDKNFNEDIFVKTNIAEVLDKELSHPSWNNATINLGGVCDSYQPIERETKLMRDVLGVLIKHKNPIVISTKSDLILRDLDLIEELSHDTKVNISICMTSTHDNVSKNVEPRASLPQQRFNALKEISKTNAVTGLHVFPILPLIEDSKKTLETFVQIAYVAKVKYMLTGMLYLTGGIKGRYLDFINMVYPSLLENYQSLYKKGSADIEYKSEIHGYLKEMREKYKVLSYYDYIKIK